MKERTWFNASQLKGVRSRVIAAINTANDGAEVCIEINTAKKIIRAIDQAIHTEEGHGNV